MRTPTPVFVNPTATLSTGGIQQLLLATGAHIADAAARLAGKIPVLAGKILANPVVLYTKPRDTFLALWLHVDSIRETLNPKS